MTRPGTRMPRLASCGIRQRYGPTRSRRKLPSSRSAGGRRCRGAATRPGHARDGDEHADDARQLRDTDRAEPEAVQPQGLDGETADRVETDVREEQSARPMPEPRAQNSDEQQEDREVPDRLVEEGRVEVL